MGNAKTEKRKAQQKRKRERDLAKNLAAEVLQKVSSWRHVYTVMSNLSDGNCGLWAVFLHALVDGGMDARTAQEFLSLKGASPQDRVAMKDLTMLCRERVVDYARLTGQTFGPVDGPVRTEDEIGELLRGGKIRSHSEWELVHLTKDSYFCDEGVRLLGELFGLHGTRVVQDYGKGLFDTTTGRLTDTCLPMSNLVLHRGHHFEALVDKESVKKPGADRSGPGDCTWMVAYLTELLSQNFDALVAQHSVGTGTVPGSSVRCLLFTRIFCV